MNEELKNQLAQFLEKALDVANKGIDTAGEQIPALLQEIVNYQIAYGVFCSALAVLFFILIAISFFIARWGEDKDNFTLIITGISGFIISTFLTSVCFIKAMVLIKALSAPRLVILEYLKGLL